MPTAAYQPRRRHRHRGPRGEVRHRGTDLAAEAAEENTQMATEGEEEDTKALAGEEAEAEAEAEPASTTEGTSGASHLANGDEARHLPSGNLATAGAEDGNLHADAEEDHGAAAPIPTKLPEQILSVGG
jgi:hypothetical protein